MKLSVKASSFTYDVNIGKGLLENAGSLFRLDRKVLIVSDSNIPSAYISTLKKQCGNPFLFVFRAGEESKNISVYTEILECLLHHEFTRTDCIVALGGGVCGDMAGFAASTYMRGIDFYNIPTTVLSMVDSSIGGKTAVDLDGVKNIVGTFYPPKGVLIDTDTLRSLSPRQVHAGLAEAIKMAATSDPDLFSFIENSTDLEKDMETIIFRSLSIKKAVVEQDEKEGGIRRILNFGHTIGHAVETLSGGELMHGECVAIGMVYMTDASIRSRLVRVLSKYDLPTFTSLDRDEIVSLIYHDKKSSDDSVYAVFLHAIGNAEIRKTEIPEIGVLL